MRLTYKLLDIIEACSDDLELFKRFNLEGLDKKCLKDQPDYNGFVSWLNDRTITYIDDSIKCTRFGRSKVYTVKNLAVRCDHSDGSWYVREYNDRGLITEYNDYKGYKNTYDYNSKGLLTRYNGWWGDWHEFNYNDKGFVIRFESSSGFWETYEYNDNDLKIRTNHSDHKWDKYEYNDKNLEVKYEQSNGNYRIKEYNDKDLLIKINSFTNKEQPCNEEKYTYDDKDKLIRLQFKDSVVNFNYLEE